jgi:hypothetical protein
MPVLKTKGALSAQGYGLTTPVQQRNYIEDVFSTWLYTGNGSVQTITNNIDLSTKGGMVWMKSRSAATDHAIYDTARGALFDIASNTTSPQTVQATGLTAFGTTGFTIGALAKINTNAETYTSWTFRKQPKFFDVVTYTGTGANRNIAHNLGSVPGCIIVKRTDLSQNWAVYHRGMGIASQQYGILNEYFGTPTSDTTVWNSTYPTSSVFTVGTSALSNANGATYVAYIFAHNAGGFGASNAENVISCDTFFTDSSGIANVTLGYEPQWVLIKDLTDSQYYAIYDVMRGLTVSVSGSRQLFAGTSGAEGANPVLAINATGFNISQYPDTQYIYIAIRRGPMKPPTVGTSVFTAALRTGTGTNTTVTNAVFPLDFIFSANPDRTATSLNAVYDRLRGTNAGWFATSDGGSETYTGATDITSFAVQNGYNVSTSVRFNGFGKSYINWFFRRASGFFDVVCYAGTASNTTQIHNLAAVPQLIFVKKRSSIGDWAVYSSVIANTEYLFLNLSDAKATSATYWNSTTPTSSVFSLGNNGNVNGGGTYVAYLFATVAGVSKVGSYTGTGALQTVNCGFTTGARFVLIKRTDSTGDWYAWDSARGISSGNDPYLILNTTGAEVTGTNYVDTDATGFKVTAAAPAALNASGGTYLFLAIA